MKKCSGVLFITDSLGAARVLPEYIPAHSSWPYKVQEMLRGEDILCYFDIKQGRDSGSLKKDIEAYLKAYEVKIIVLQIGIVDCYPRALKKWEVNVFKKTPILGKVVHNFIKKYYSKIVSFRDISYVSQDEFLKNLNHIKKNLSFEKVLVIPIAPACSELSKKNSMVETAIREYNKLFKSVFLSGYLEDFYDSFDEEASFISDGHHFNSLGNEYVSNKIFEILKREL